MSNEGRRPDSGKLPEPASGAHEKKPGEAIRSRSDDPGQSSYGGFSGQDPRRQAQDLHPEGGKRGADERAPQGKK